VKGGSAIEWTDHTWSPIRGCTKVSAGCRDCWAKREVDQRWSHNPKSPWYGRRFEDVTLNPQALAHVAGMPAGSKVFVCPRSDLFHEAVPFEYIAAVFGVMGLFRELTFQVLTKRAARMADFFNWVEWEGRARYGAWHLCLMSLLKAGADAPMARLWKRAEPALRASEERDEASAWPLPNVWLGVTAEDQQALSDRLPHLLGSPAAVRWLSLEPLIGPVRLCDVECRSWCLADGPVPRGASLPPPATSVDALHGVVRHGGGARASRTAKVDWVVVGGERGPRARAMAEEWLRQIVADCQLATTPVFFKQWGDWVPRSQAPRAVPDVYPDVKVLRVGKRAAGARLDGREYRQFPVCPGAPQPFAERRACHAIG
jgi:protein gp37